jgi:hypothetical protein
LLPAEIEQAVKLRWCQQQTATDVENSIAGSTLG